MKDKDFGERIKELRKNAGLSGKDVADKLHIALPTLYQYERGEREPSFETLISFALYFNVSTDYLLGLTDNPSPTTSEISLDATGLDEGQLIVVKKVVSNFKEINEKIEESKTNKA